METPQGTQVRWVLDTGAAHTVAPRDTAPPGYTAVDNDRSRSGQHWVSATGHVIPNEGTQSVPALTSEGKLKPLSWQVGDITRPLLSVGEICDNGKRVVFGKMGGYIQCFSPETQTWEVEHQFARRGHLYEMDVLIPPVEVAQNQLGFTRHGM